MSHLLLLSANEKIALFDEIVRLLLEKNTVPSSEPKRRLEKPPVRKPSSGKYEHVSSISPKDETCFHLLKTWRNKVAVDIGIPAYMIFDNKTLMSMAHYRPQNEEDLLKIKGMGREKLGKYSETILNIIKRSEPSTKRFLGSNQLEYVSDHE